MLNLRKPTSPNLLPVARGVPLFPGMCEGVGCNLGLYRYPMWAIKLLENSTCGSTLISISPLVCAGLFDRITTAILQQMREWTALLTFHSNTLQWTWLSHVDVLHRLLGISVQEPANCFGRLNLLLTFFCTLLSSSFSNLENTLQGLCVPSHLRRCITMNYYKSARFILVCTFEKKIFWSKLLRNYQCLPKPQEPHDIQNSVSHILLQVAFSAAQPYV